MSVEFRDAGAKMLLNYLEKSSKVAPLTVSEIDEIIQQSDIATWISVYEEWMKGTREEFVCILQSIHEETDIEFGKWGQHINQGLRDSLPMLEQMMEKLTILSGYDWTQTASEALQFLPQDTVLDVDVIVTIDGFNGAMYHGNNIFLSLTILDSSIIEPKYFTHELHHIGMRYWWEKNPVVKSYNNENESREAWLLRLYHYMVSEGLANAFCSPEMLRSVEGRNECTEKHNRIIDEYANQLDEIYDLLESLLLQIIENTTPEVKDLYDKLAFDTENHHHPKGHYLSGMMIQMMDESQKITREELVNLVKEPFTFFHKYNNVARAGNHREISDTILKSIEHLLLTKNPRSTQQV